jgi:hypothetical protein
MTIGVGLWDPAKGAYLAPQPGSATADTPGGAGPSDAAIVNVGPRYDEPFPDPTQVPTLTLADSAAGAAVQSAWWREHNQAQALASGDVSQFHADVDFAKLASGATDDSQIPTSGPIDRILASHFEPGQGADFSHECGLNGASNPSSCSPEYLGQLEPYQLYVPSGSAPATGWGMTLLLHSLSANYNQYMATNNQSQFASRAVPSLVLTPEARGPDQFYEGLGEADVFEAWADVARYYSLDPAYTEITGYSMGGIGTFDVGAQFPDLFARAQPTVGDESDNNVLASFRNLPVLMWNTLGDELVGPELYGPTAAKLGSLGYRYESDIFQPCASTLCSPLFPNHLELAINDQFAPAAAFLDTASVDRNPAHVTYVVDPARDSSKYGVVADHAYWLGGLTVRQSGSEGQIDAISHGFGVGDPTPSGVQPGTGTLTGGNMGSLAYTSNAQTWGPTPSAPSSDTIDIKATNVATASINVQRANVDCNVNLNLTTDGPIAVTLLGCKRVVKAG